MYNVILINNSYIKIIFAIYIYYVVCTYSNLNEINLQFDRRFGYVQVPCSKTSTIESHFSNNYIYVL